MSTSLHTEPAKYAPPCPLPPQALLWEALKPVLIETGALEMYFRLGSEQIVQVDRAPRHDTVLDETDVQQFLFRNSMDDCNALHDAASVLRRTNEELARAANKIKGRFGGEVKVNLTDRLLRHLAEGQALLEVARSQHQTFAMPNRPFEIRQRCMASLFRRVNDVHEMLSRIRTECKHYELQDDSCSLLLELETQLARIRGKLGKWRDNPSQKLGLKLTDAYAQVSSIHRSIQSLHSGLEAKCRLLGIRFRNRNGPI